MKSLLNKIGFGKKEERKLAGSLDEAPKASPHLPEEALFKILVAGPSGTGKTKILLRYLDGQFNENCFVTMGAEFKIKITQEISKETAR